MPAIHPVLADLPEYPIERVSKARQALVDAGREVFDFGTGDPLEPTPEFIRQALAEGVPAVCRYPRVFGLRELRAAAAGYVQRRFGVTLDPDTEVLPSRGSKESIFHLPLAFMEPRGPRDTVVFPTPGYTVYDRGTRFAGGRPIGVPLTPENDFLLKPWELPAEVQERLAILWVNYPHNPTGALAPDDYLQRLADYARERDVVVCSDECYVDVYASAAPRSLLEFGRENVLAFHSCSKRSGMTGYRSGFMAGDAKLLATYARLRPNVGVAGSEFVERAAAAAWSDDAHAVARRELFGAKRALFTAFFAEHGLEVEGGDATFFLWFRPPHGVEAEAYCTQLLELGIVVVPGAYFGEGGEGFCRLALVPPLEECRRAVEVWGAALRGDSARG